MANCNRLVKCCGKQRKVLPKMIVGGTGVIVFWASVASLIMIGIYRHECSADSHVVPLMMVPTSVMGIFSALFIWMFVGFVWEQGIKDFMQFMTAASSIITFALEFVTFGFAVSRKDDVDCTDPFLRFSLGMPFVNGLMFIIFFVAVGYEKCKGENRRTNPT